MKNKFTYWFLQWEVYINSAWRLTFLTVNPHITGCSAGTESSLISQTYRLCAGHSQPLLFPVGSTTQNSVCSCSHHFLLFHGKRHPPLLDFFFFFCTAESFSGCECWGLRRKNAVIVLLCRAPIVTEEEKKKAWESLISGHVWPRSQYLTSASTIGTKKVKM